MALTPKQLEYARHRASGLGQARAAVEAGYAVGSAKVSASKLEHRPDIQEAIAAAREAGKAAGASHGEDYDAEGYLAAVVAGKAVPDPQRIAAAKALLPYLRAKTRAPVKSRPPKELAASAELTNATDLNTRFRNRVVAIAAARGHKGT